MKISHRWFPETVTLNKSAGTDDYGQPIPGATKDSPAQIQTGNRVVRSDGGTETVIRLTVKMPGNVDMEDVQTMTLPEQGTLPVDSWRKVRAAREIAYTEVFFS